MKQSAILFGLLLIQVTICAPSGLDTADHVLMKVQISRVLSQVQRTNAIILIQECLSIGMDSTSHLYYVLATAIGQSDLVPEKEKRAKQDSVEWEAQNAYWYTGYYGRGYSQLTSYQNYQIFGRLLSVDLLNNPNLALDPVIASKILCLGMMKGLFKGKRLQDYLTDQSLSWTEAWQTLSDSSDKASLVADIAISIHGSRSIRFGQTIPLKFDIPIPCNYQNHYFLKRHNGSYLMFERSTEVGAWEFKLDDPKSARLVSYDNEPVSNWLATIHLNEYRDKYLLITSIDYNEQKFSVVLSNYDDSDPSTKFRKLVSFHHKPSTFEPTLIGSHFYYTDLESYQVVRYDLEKALSHHGESGPFTGEVIYDGGPSLSTVAEDETVFVLTEEKELRAVGTDLKYNIKKELEKMVPGQTDAIWLTLRLTTFKDILVFVACHNNSPDWYLLFFRFKRVGDHIDLKLVAKESVDYTMEIKIFGTRGDEILYVSFADAPKKILELRSFKDDRSVTLSRYALTE